MNKQEVLEALDSIVVDDNSPERMLEEQMMKVVEIVERLDEPQKVKVPAFVADYIKWCRDRKWQLHTMVMPSNAEYFESHSESSGLHEWINENYATFLIAIATGDYEVEEEPEWVVKRGLFYFDEFDSQMDGDKFGFNGDQRITEAYHFSDKSKAEAVADLIGGEVKKV